MSESLLLVVVSEAHFEEGGDGVDPLELLPAVLLCGLQTAVEMATDEGHADGVGGGGSMGAGVEELELGGDDGI